MPAPVTTAAAPYSLVKQHLRDALAQGRFRRAALMPSETELVAQFGVSRMTVNRALRELQSDGPDRAGQGVGTFAAQLHRVSSTLRIRDLHGDPRARPPALGAGRAPGCRNPRPPARRAARLEPGDGVPLRHRPLGGRGAAAVRGPLRQPGLRPEFLSVDFTLTTPTHYLFEVTALWRAQFSIEAALPTAEEAALLGIGAGDPCLIVVRRTFTTDAVITIARLVQPAHATPCRASSRRDHCGIRSASPARSLGSRRPRRRSPPAVRRGSRGSRPAGRRRTRPSGPRR